MKYLRGRNAVEDLLYEIPSSDEIAEALPYFDSGYALAFRRKGESWRVIYTGSIQGAKRMYRAVKRQCKQFRGIMGAWEEYSEGIVYAANTVNFPHRRTEWYAAGVIIDNGEENENRQIETIRRNFEEGGETVLKAEYEETEETT